MPWKILPLFITYSFLSLLKAANFHTMSDTYTQRHWLKAFDKSKKKEKKRSFCTILRTTANFPSSFLSFWGRKIAQNLSWNLDKWFSVCSSTCSVNQTNQKKFLAQKVFRLENLRSSKTKALKAKLGQTITKFGISILDCPQSAKSQIKTEGTLGGLPSLIEVKQENDRVDKA